MLKKTSRLKKIAELVNLDLHDPNLLQILTDIMNQAGEVQMNYQNSGWRTIYPISWATSKDNNFLMVCYKDSGEIRTYRLDRILELKLDDSLLLSQYPENTFPDLPNEVNNELPYSNDLQQLNNNDTNEINEFNNETENNQLDNGGI